MMNAVEAEALTLWQKVRGQEPVSAWSSWTFLAGGVLVELLFHGLRGIVFLGFSFGLALSTFLFHFLHTKAHDDFDAAGMAGQLVALLVLIQGGAWWMMLGLGLLAVFALVYNRKTKVNDHLFVIGLGLLCAVALYGKGQYLWLLTSLLWALLGAYYWRKPFSRGRALTEAGNLHVAGDWHHGTWHCCEAAAIFCGAIGAFLAH